MPANIAWGSLSTPCERTGHVSWFAEGLVTAALSPRPIARTAVARLSVELVRQMCRS
jgi:hypothetical protein